MIASRLNVPRRISAILLCALLFDNDAWAAAVACGFVSDVRPVGAQVEIERDGQRIPAAAWTTLRRNDRIIIQSDGISAEIKTNTKPPRSIGMAQSPFVLTECLDLPGPVANAVQYVRDLVGGDRMTTLGWEAGTRGDGAPIEVAFLGSRARLAAGERIVSLVWRGGSPPFSVDVRGPGGSSVASEKNVAGRRISTPRIALVPGVYRVGVADAHTSASGTFEVLPANVVAVPPTRIAEWTTDSGVGTILRSLWLSDSGVDGGKWRFEAWQRLREVAERYEAARVASLGLEDEEAR